jgi:hypothetical protein
VVCMVGGVGVKPDREHLKQRSKFGIVSPNKLNRWRVQPADPPWVKTQGSEDV